MNRSRVATGAAALAAGLFLVACGGDDGSKVEAGAGHGYEVESYYLPSAVHEEAGRFPGLALSSAGGTATVIASDGVGFRDTWVEDEVTGEWSSVGGPPADGVLLSATDGEVPGGVLVAGALCASADKVVDLDDGSACDGGLEGIEVWLLDGESLRWERVAIVTADEAPVLGERPQIVDGADDAAVHFVGAADSTATLWVTTGTNGSSLVNVDVESGALASLGVVEGGIDPACVTASGAVIARQPAGDPTIGDTGEVTLPDEGLAVLAPDSDGWSPIPSVATSYGEDELHCLTDSLVVVGDLSWEEFGLDGESRAGANFEASYQPGDRRMLQEMGGTTGDDFFVVRHLATQGEDTSQIAAVWPVVGHGTVFDYEHGEGAAVALEGATILSDGTGVLMSTRPGVRGGETEPGVEMLLVYESDSPPDDDDDDEDD